ncbi:MAG: nitroreductase family protein [Paludibacteraceae bacterium]|nr:nitroreductase family protein [Paludibacteraceae bacterium]
MGTFLELCQKRRSIRQYTCQPVEQEKIDYILRCALMSPSGKRINPWEFYVLRADDAQCTDSASGHADMRIIRQLAGVKTYGAQMFDTAMAAIVVAADTSLSDIWQCDASIAAHNMLLAAAEQGLGACWCHIHGRDDSEQMVHELCHIPANLTVLCVISLGYKNEERKDYDLDKLRYDKIHRLTD